MGSPAQHAVCLFFCQVKQNENFPNSLAERPIIAGEYTIALGPMRQSDAEWQMGRQILHPRIWEQNEMQGKTRTTSATPLISYPTFGRNANEMI